MKDKGRLVQIETTAQHLLSSLKIPKDLEINDIQSQVFLNPVCYLSRAEEKIFQRTVADILCEKNKEFEFDLARLASLYAKRKPFAYEKEVRLVFRLPISPSREAVNHCELDLDPVKMIIALKIDPWCGEHECRMIQDRLKKMWYPCTQSELARPLI